MEDFDSTETFVVNYEKVLTDSSLLGTTRLLAHQAVNSNYITVGNFLKDISTYDLSTLVDIVESGDSHSNFGDLILLSEMLAAGEGLEPGTLETALSRMSMFFTLIICESLARKGLVKVYHNNMSFGEDMANAIIVEKLND